MACIHKESLEASLTKKVQYPLSIKNLLSKIQLKSMSFNYYKSDVVTYTNKNYIKESYYYYLYPEKHVARLYTSQSMCLSEPMVNIHFRLDLLLRLNITFVEFYMFIPGGKPNITIHRISDRSLIFAYTGQHSTFSVYLPFKNVPVIIYSPDTTAHKFCRLNMIYTVLDRNLIYNNVTNVTSYLKPHLMYKLGNQLLFTSYIINVKKIYQIVSSRFNCKQIHYI